MLQIVLFRIFEVLNDRFLRQAQSGDPIIGST